MELNFPLPRVQYNEIVSLSGPNNYVVTPIIVFIVLEPGLSNLHREEYGMPCVCYANAQMANIVIVLQFSKFLKVKDVGVCKQY